jgi:hypothetical protein
MNNFCVPNPADLPFIVEQRLDAKSPMALNIERRELPLSGPTRLVQKWRRREASLDSPDVCAGSLLLRILIMPSSHFFVLFSAALLGSDTLL